MDGFLASVQRGFWRVVWHAFTGTAAVGMLCVRSMLTRRFASPEHATASDCGQAQEG